MEKVSKGLNTGLRVKGIERIVKKSEAKREKISTMPLMLFKNFNIISTIRKGKAFSAKLIYKQVGIPTCPNCKSGQLVKYGNYKRKTKLLSIDKQVYDVVITAKRYKCKCCSSVFREEIESLKRFKRTCENFKEQIVKYYDLGAPNKKIANHCNVSASTVERILHERFQVELKEQLNYDCPQILGIDEHTIHKGYKFATTLCDLKHHRIYDVIEGKSSSMIESYLMRVKGREKVKVVCMDLSSTYRSIARKCFPNAKIVADRFHVIRLVITHFMTFCREIEPDEVRWQRGITNLLRTHRKNIKIRRKERLEQLDKFLEKYPAIKHAYEFKEMLCEILNRKEQNVRECKINIRELKAMMKIMKYESVKEFEKLAQTISDWWSPIIRMWRFTKTNSITEGFHRKMKLIQRVAYGFKNFENYRLRVRVSCGDILTKI